MRVPVGELARFGGVGVLATLVHSAVYVLSLGALAPQAANVAGFLVAAGVSFFGHRHFSFRTAADRRTPMRASLLRFAVASGIGFCLNAGFVYLTTDVLEQPAWMAVWFICFATPAAMFVLFKFWAFRPLDGETPR